MRRADYGSLMTALEGNDRESGGQSELELSVRLLERQAARVLGSARADDTRTTVVTARALAARALEFTSCVRAGGTPSEHPAVALMVADTLLDALARAHAEVQNLGSAGRQPRPDRWTARIEPAGN